MRRIPQIRPRGARAASAAALAAFALVAGLITPAAAAGPASPAGEAEGAEAAGADGFTRLTLVTGDRVTVDGAGRPVGFHPAPGREKIAVSVERDNGRTSLVPADVRPLVLAGRLDARLFDITELSRPEYRRARGGGDRLRLIVSYEKGFAPGGRAALRGTGDGLRVDRTYEFLGAEAVSSSSEGAAAAWQALTGGRARGLAPGGSPSLAPGVAKVWLDSVRSATLDRTTGQIGADRAWEAGYDGTGVKIAVLDTGVDSTHPDLVGKVVAEQNFTVTEDAKDRHGHGTHVSSIAAGTGAKSGGKLKGVAPGASILNGKVLNDQGYGGDSEIIAGMEWAVAQGAQIVNMSLAAADYPGVDPLEEAVNRLSERGVLFAVAAGNAGEWGSRTVDSPGSADAALTVGAVDDSDVLAPFSGKGPRLGDGAIKPDVTAPGVDVAAAAVSGGGEGGDPDGYVSMSGTSMATPHAAGAAALLKQQHPGWTGSDLKAVLTGSTKPGAYTAFEQGTGRISVVNALRQPLAAEPLSLSYAAQPWPHQDDTPEKKRLTYRNLGADPVVLDVSGGATGPGGDAAPAGFLSFDTARVTVPAGGSASVGVTVDTRIAGLAPGTYSGYVVASGPGGQSVRTGMAVEIEAEAYDLTVKHIGRDGKEPTSYFAVLKGMTGDGADRQFWWGGGTTDGQTGTDTYKLRVPPGSYMFDSTIRMVVDDDAKGVDWMAQPRLDITGDTTLNVDARTAKPVDITVPSKSATLASASFGYELRLPTGSHGFGKWVTNLTGLRTAHMGPDVGSGPASALQRRGQSMDPVPVTTLFQQWDTHWRDGAAEEYHLVSGGPVQRLATGHVQHVKRSELATVTVEQGSSAPGKVGEVVARGMLPDSIGDSLSYLARPLPGSVKLHLSAKDGVLWNLSTVQSALDADGSPVAETEHRGGTAAYQAGRTYRERFGAGVFGPRMAPEGGYALFRRGDRLFGGPPLMTDGAGHPGRDHVGQGKTVLYSKGKEIGRYDVELSGSDGFAVPAANASYKLVTSFTRPQTVSRISTEVTATWWFRSKTPADDDPDGKTKVAVPVSTVHFAPELSLSGTSPADRKVRIPVTVLGGKPKSLTVQVSYDEGRTWRTVPLADGAVTVRNPAKGGHVSLRGTVTDATGNRSEITVTRAYLTH
ncbi:S8 family serine peptidase [Streptomyces sp. TBY4]|uniref:S8 family peptidase n=1 Tax=Streptomyces sp. TBY4 TaxID=2962030 RepID=UPI0020B841B3|nr:S8 family serine peptidase [Streptomyces sp. TBY4]MCP3758014.1 S8 family serine peptidase [Streptomyces sp. TBY4]